MLFFFRNAYQYYLSNEDSLRKTHMLVIFIARIYLALAFFNTGLFLSQETSLNLFPFEIEVILGTLTELIFPILLSLGLLSRFCAFCLFIVNTLAILTLAGSTTEALYMHYFWGILLLQILVYGAGPLSLDQLTTKQCMNIQRQPPV